MESNKLITALQALFLVALVAHPMKVAAQGNSNDEFTVSDLVEIDTIKDVPSDDELLPEEHLNILVKSDVETLCKLTKGHLVPLKAGALPCIDNLARRYSPLDMAALNARGISVAVQKRIQNYTRSVHETVVAGTPQQ